MTVKKPLSPINRSLARKWFDEVTKGMAPEKILDFIEDVRDVLHESSPVKDQPVDRVRWVPIEMVSPNDYNPNSVAGKEMDLLYTSIKQDGYTQPVVTIHDPKRNRYVIIDGFQKLAHYLIV